VSDAMAAKQRIHYEEIASPFYRIISITDAMPAKIHTFSRSVDFSKIATQKEYIYTFPDFAQRSNCDRN
jgi:hypothetical protein